MCSMANGKRYDNAVKAFDREATFAPNEAVAMSKKLATAKFDETIELVCRLGVDPRKAEEMVRGTVALPSGTGRNVRVAVFAHPAQHAAVPFGARNIRLALLDSCVRVACPRPEAVVRPRLRCHNGACRQPCADPFEES